MRVGGYPHNFQFLDGELRWGEDGKFQMFILVDERGRD